MPRLVADPEAYFRTLVPEPSEAERRLSQAASSGHVPSIGPVMGRLLTLLCRIAGARRVLELGSAVGYSSYFLARAIQDMDGLLVCVDMHDRHCRNTLGALADVPRSGVVCADARCLPFGPGCFDLVFLDVDQRYYAGLEAVCYDLLRPGGVLVADNTSFTDARPFNALMGNETRWETVNLLAFWPEHAPERDGICLARKR